MKLTLPQNTQLKSTTGHITHPHYKNTFSACACLCRPHASRVHHVSLRLLYYIKAHAKPFGLFRWRHSQNHTDGSPQNRIKSQGAFDNERNEENSSLNDCITLSSTPFPLSPSLPLDISLNPERTEDFISSSICNQHQTRAHTLSHPRRHFRSPRAVSPVSSIRVSLRTMHYGKEFRAVRHHEAYRAHTQQE